MKNLTTSKQFKFSSALFLAAPLCLAVITACSSPKDPQLGQGAEPDQLYSASSGDTEAAAVPKVDILFVADDSDSMSKHLAGVHANMETFVNQFAADANVDFHVGLVKVFDSTRYGTPKVPVFVPNGELQNDALDKQLIASLLAKTPVASEADQKALIESTPHWVGQGSTKAETVANLQQLLDFNTKSIADGGPNKEEIFSPIVTALFDPAASTGRNNGFLRPEANLAIIILTDAEDSSPQYMNANDPYDKSKVPLVHAAIARSKGDDVSKISIYAALAGKEADGTNCVMDIDNQQPDKIKALVESFHGSTDAEKAAHEFNICGEFGATMKKVGQDISARVKVDNVIPLPAPLDQTQPVVVTYGLDAKPKQVVAASNWTYDSIHNVIRIINTPEGIPGAKFYVSYMGMSQKELVRRSKLKH